MCCSRFGGNISEMGVIRCQCGRKKTMQVTPFSSDLYSTVTFIVSVTVISTCCGPGTLVGSQMHRDPVLAGRKHQGSLQPVKPEC